MGNGNPQLEGGYTRISNELLGALLQARLTKNEMLIILAVARNTFGWNRKFAQTSVTWLSEQTTLSRAHASEARASCFERGFLIRERPKSEAIGINKNYMSWGVPKTGTGFLNQERGVPETGTKGFLIQEQGVPETGTKGVPDSGTNKRQSLVLDKDMDKDMDKDKREVDPPPAHTPNLSEGQKSKDKSGMTYCRQPNRHRFKDHVGRIMAHGWHDGPMCPQCEQDRAEDEHAKKQEADSTASPEFVEALRNIGKKIGRGME